MYMFGCRILYQLYTTHLSDLKLSSTTRREVLTPSNDVVVGPSICQLACTLVEPIEHRDVGVSRGMHYSIARSTADGLACSHLHHVQA